MLSNEQKRKVGISLRRFQRNNKEYTKQIRRKAAYASALIQSKYTISKSEAKLGEWLNEQYPGKFERSVILGFFQFDFGNKEHKLLIEMHGDYWHGNPTMYNKLNYIQRQKQKRDEQKKTFCATRQIKLLVIWETDVLNNNFSKLKQNIDEIFSTKDS